MARGAKANRLARILRGLDRDQRKAVLTKSNRLLIEACPGAGKTEIIVRRVARMVEDGIPAKQVLVLAFGQDAANELRKRVRSFTPKAAQVECRTVHSFAFTILRSFREQAELPSRWKVLTDEQATQLMKRAIKGLDSGRPAAMTAFELMRIRSLKANLQWSLKGTLKRHFPERDDWSEIVAVLRAYRELKEGENALDFDDLLERATHLLLTNDLVRNRVRRAHRHILADEGHDLSPLQAKLIACLGPKGPAIKRRSLTVVRDAAQAIFWFRGASAKSSSACFGKGTPFKIVLLKSYRSTQEILDFASVVDPLQRRLQSQSANRHGAKPTLTAYTSGRAEAHAIVRQIEEHRENGIDLSNQAVLMRSMHSARWIEQELLAARIPFAKRGGGKRHQDCQAQQLVLALLRFAAAPRDQERFREFCRDVLGLSKWKSDRLGIKCQRIAASADIQPSKKIGRLIQLSIPKVRQARGELMAGRFAALGRRSQEAAKAARLGDLINSMIVELRSASPTGVPGAIELTTIHAAKGRQWEVVFVPQLKNGVFPSRHATTSSQRAEEKNLFFVALTRAKIHLHLTSTVPKQRVDGKPLKSRASEFLRDPGFKGLFG